MSDAVECDRPLGPMDLVQGSQSRRASTRDPVGNVSYSTYDARGSLLSSLGAGVAAGPFSSSECCRGRVPSPTREDPKPDSETRGSSAWRPRILSRISQVFETKPSPLHTFRFVLPWYWAGGVVGFYPPSGDDRWHGQGEE